MADKMNLHCLECGKKFKSANADTSCPKCGSVDLDLDDVVFFYRPKMRAALCDNNGRSAEVE